MIETDEPNVRILKPGEVATVRLKAYQSFMFQLEGTGFTVTAEYIEKWWGIDQTNTQTSA